jgi:hypothetical protein
MRARFGCLLAAGRGPAGGHGGSQRRPPLEALLRRNGSSVWPTSESGSYGDPIGRVGAARISSESSRSQGFTMGTKAATKAAWWLGASGNARGGELDSFYRRSCLGEGVTVWRKGGARRDGEWQPRGTAARVWRRARGAHAKYGGAAIGWAAARSVCSACECGTHGDEGLGGAVGPAVAAVHRRLCPVDRQRELAWPRAQRRTWARTRGTAVLKNST